MSSRRIVPSAISYSDDLPAIPVGVRSPRQRGWIARWLTFLALAWWPWRPIP